MKIVFIVVRLFAALGVAAIAAGYYAVHKVKQAVVAKAESYGVDLNSIPSPIPSSTLVPSTKSTSLAKSSRRAKPRICWASPLSAPRSWTRPASTTALPAWRKNSPRREHRK